MNNDLISREALKKAINDNGCRHSHYFDIFDIIDNAPTIEPQKVLVAHVTFDADKLKEIVQTEVIDKIKSGELVLEVEEKRTQGKWEEPFESNGKTYHKCNHCHISSELILFGNFCPNCGADMREEGGK